ncbi:MAG: dihydrodipicolinate reductase [Bdellovibrionales bacterium RIFCSPHIGHO2_01_FULL_40_29]|nr:MAG: dihydrodipicolinate reductase [Bdellovibrionales bacterium RIFCSPHIGHO2_01_FULL_40_29]OFZ34130.1 MAG: dihydrodipicolinate reductase [Bdellovibrionales bacterium RIFCSPHIGHO2_02_FULL_40_15]
MRVGLLGFGRTGSLVAKEIVNDAELSLEWVCRKTIPTNLNYASHSIGFDDNFAPFVSFENMSKDFLKKYPVDIVIDFSSSAAAASYDILAKAGIRIITAISKYAPEDFIRVQKASEITAVLASPNITLGINWLMIASKVLKHIIPHADIEVVEEHFRDKKEISGTALKLATQLDLEPNQHVNSIRVGGIVGRHEVIFGLPYQTIRLTHESVNRAAFGTGAAFAGKWLYKKTAGLYTMEQVMHEKFLKKITELNFY